VGQEVESDKNGREAAARAELTGNQLSERDSQLPWSNSTNQELPLGRGTENNSTAGSVLVFSPVHGSYWLARESEKGSISDLHAGHGLWKGPASIGSRVELKLCVASKGRGTNALHRWLAVVEISH
jgi:hypothetical protein